MKKLIVLGLLACSGCVSIENLVGDENSPYFFRQRITAIGGAKVAAAIQNFQGELLVQSPTGDNITVNLSSAQNGVDIVTTEPQALLELTRMLVNLTKMPLLP